MHQQRGFNRLNFEQFWCKGRIYLFRSLIITGMLLLLSCARTVSDKSTILRMEMKLTMSGNVDLDHYDYYIVFSVSGSPVVPSLNVIAQQEYFPFPGRAYDEFNYDLTLKEGVNYFYRTYFSSWSDYIICSDQGAVLYKSGAEAFDKATSANNHLANYPPEQKFDFDFNVNGKTITLVFNSQDILDNNKTLYFAFITCKKDETKNLETGYLQDVLYDLSEANIDLKAGKERVNKTDSQSGKADESANIVSWEVRIL